MNGGCLQFTRKLEQKLPLPPFDIKFYNGLESKIHFILVNTNKKRDTKKVVETVAQLK